MRNSPTQTCCSPLPSTHASLFNNNSNILLMVPHLTRVQGAYKGLQMHAFQHICKHTHPPALTLTHTHTHMHPRTHTHTQTPACTQVHVCVHNNPPPPLHPSPHILKLHIQIFQESAVQVEHTHIPSALRLVSLEIRLDVLHHGVHQPCS